MAKDLTKTDEIRARLEAENKVTSTNTPQHLQKMEEMDKRLKDVRREYQIKERNAQAHSAYLILTA